MANFQNLRRFGYVSMQLHNMPKACTGNVLRVHVRPPSDDHTRLLQNMVLGMCEEWVAQQDAPMSAINWRPSHGNQ